MRNFVQALIAEAIKYHKNNFHSILTYVSMLLWPLIQMFTTYFIYKPFEGLEPEGPYAIYLTKENIFSFIIIGNLSMLFFRSFVQSAWRFSFERISGTLELIYLSPASRMGVVVGNAVSSMFSSCWMFTVFAVSMLFIFTDISFNPGMTALTMIMLTLSASAWGVFLNSLFLFSRDSSFLFTLLEEPMEIFAGVRIPPAAFPFLIKIVAAIFPLTWVLKTMRMIFIEQAGFYELRYELIRIAVIIVTLYIATHFLLILGERHARRTGNMTLF